MRSYSEGYPSTSERRSHEDHLNYINQLFPGNFILGKIPGVAIILQADSVERAKDSMAELPLI